MESGVLVYQRDPCLKQPKQHHNSQIREELTIYTVTPKVSGGTNGLICFKPAMPDDTFLAR